MFFTCDEKRSSPLCSSPHVCVARHSEQGLHSLKNIISDMLGCSMELKYVFLFLERASKVKMSAEDERVNCCRIVLWFSRDNSLLMSTVRPYKVGTSTPCT